MRTVIFIWTCLTLSMACNSHQDQGDLELDHGKKWMVNDDMKPHIAAGEQMLARYIETGDTDYHALAKGLKRQNEQLIKSCTMEGQGHDELHKWLHPHMKLIDELAQTNDPSEAQNIIERLQGSFRLYGSYFE
jgi:hypothetical protein